MHRARVRPRLLAAAAVAVLGTAAIVTVTNASQAASTGCRVDYAVGGQWPGGFIARVTVTNYGSALDGWTASWSASGGEKVLQGWGADVRQSGGSVTAKNLAWNARLAANGSASFGFVGLRDGIGTAVMPSGFRLNGVACNGQSGGGSDAPDPAPTVTLPVEPPASQPRPTRTTQPAPTGTTPTVAPVPTPVTPTAPPATTTAGSSGGGSSDLSQGIPEGYRVVENAKPNTVRVFWLKPSDVAFDRRWPDGMAKVVKETQRFYEEELGKTFTLNDQVVEVIEGDHPKAWYETTPQGEDRYWWAVANMEKEIHRKLAYQDIDQWVNVAEVSAEGEGGGGGGGNGWVVLNQHDADGAAGVNGDLNRWYGGMVHEMGHALGLPDSTYTDGTPMSASFYSYPNCHFTQSQKQGILAGHWAKFMS